VGHPSTIFGVLEHQRRCGAPVRLVIALKVAHLATRAPLGGDFGFQGKLQGKLGRSRVNSRGKLSPIWSIFCHYVAHKKPHQANTYPLGLLRWHGGLRCPLCAVYNPPPKPYGELNRPNIMNHGTQSWIQNSNRFGFARVNHACGMPHASTSFEYGCCIQ
jgi:hypothetical protein